MSAREAVIVSTARTPLGKSARRVNLSHGAVLADTYALPSTVRSSTRAKSRTP